MSIRGSCYDRMCGGCHWCQPELADCCIVHGPGHSPDECEACADEERLRNEEEDHANACA